MILLNILRRKFFWILDKLKGGHIKTELNDITSSLALPTFKNLQAKKKPVLETLLKNTVEHSPYYQEFKGYKSLQDFPVVNKSIIKENFDIIYPKPQEISNLNKVSTSGSTGEPFIIFQSNRKKTRNTADTIFFAKSSGFELGEQLLYLRSWTAYYKKNTMLAKLQNILQLSIDNNSDDYYAQLIGALQKNRSPKGWLGYPSGFENICNYLDKIKSKPLHCNISSIIGMSESLSDSTKKRMEYYFQAPAVSRYSNVENGIIAQQMPGKNNFTINWASYIVEILDLSTDLPAKKGELGRIVVTDLYNLATPMIRYDTGDIGTFTVDSDKENNFPEFKNIQGRAMDSITNSNGNIINPFTIYNNLYRYPEISQIQLIQKSKTDYTFLLNLKEEFARKEEFITFFKAILGDEAIVSIKFVNNIPLLKSGKRKIIVNDYNYTLN
jgi:phenylacetate-CoA ligase